MENIFVGNTDNEWFDFLASQSGLDEINFWKPSPSNFSTIREGEKFAFRLKSPRNKIGGFGIFAKSSVLPIQIAWETFGPKNGVASLSAMVAAIAKYRRHEVVTPSTFIGCRILVEPVFLPEFSWFDIPVSWSPSIVQGKTFSTATTEGESLWDSLRLRAPSAGRQLMSVAEDEGARFGEAALVRPRLGQGAFRVSIMELYDRQCALTQGKVLPALDAAHIRPYAEGGTHTLPNGILLRKDIHSVFDAGYATIDPDYRFVVSDKVWDVFQNGREYRRLHGTKLRLPGNPADRPSVESLRWHNEHLYLG